FFFSSKRRHTRCYRDWSSDVCSSDLTVRSTRVLFSSPQRSCFEWHRLSSLCSDVSRLPPQPQRLLRRTVGETEQHGLLLRLMRQIGRASCRERVEWCGRAV